MTDPSKLQQTTTTSRQGKAKKLITAMPRLSSALVNGGDDDNDDQSDEGSEVDIKKSVTISALLSKLDSVRVIILHYSNAIKCFIV